MSPQMFLKDSMFSLRCSKIKVDIIPNATKIAEESDTFVRENSHSSKCLFRDCNRNFKKMFVLHEQLVRWDCALLMIFVNLLSL